MSLKHRIRQPSWPDRWKKPDIPTFFCSVEQTADWRSKRSDLRKEGRKSCSSSSAFLSFQHQSWIGRRLLWLWLRRRERQTDRRLEEDISVILAFILGVGGKAIDANICTKEDDYTCGNTINGPFSVPACSSSRVLALESNRIHSKRI